MLCYHAELATESKYTSEKGWEFIYERLIEHQLCTCMGDGKEGLILVIDHRDWAQKRTKQMRWFQLVPNALDVEKQKDGVERAWTLGVIWQKQQTLKLLIS